MTTAAVFSDAHGDAKALTRVLERVQSVQSRFFLGDVVGRGDVNRCVALLRENDVHAVAGGHDLDALTAVEDPDELQYLDDNGSVIREDFGLTQENKEYLATLPLVRRWEPGEELYWFFHGVVPLPGNPGIMQVVDESNAVEVVRRLASHGGQLPRAVFVGHSHIPRWFVIENGSCVGAEEVNGTTTISLRPGLSYAFR